ncbi:4-hydroxy-3-polyprenylbenzoate decarboxylase [Paraburkholderia tuberum]|uniref:4-hydroxy-3-polyprenylbenzoate decarboxylase n=2 Tax=Paraburkholderia tuberum TaxID=157910 RepID=A0A1H1KHJ6_9BURK|nr:UbiD family decarboxylase [Paraburkholderia tuberum]SDR61552.1 4-hydroxy-3-polyprenylbenzoate decarboxylase [Paraburkholderia tuberum]
MSDTPTQERKDNPQDLRTYLEKLERAGKLFRISRPICKETELMPLVKWQFRGLPESERRGFLFEHVVDAKGNKVNGGAAVGIYASSKEVYALGMGCDVKDVKQRWQEAQAAPIAPRIVEYGPVQEEVHMGDDLLAHGGLDEFAIPISTPGFDVGPYTTASNWVTKDPETGWLNVGNYRGQIKGPDRMGVLLGHLNHGSIHWHAYRKLGKVMPAALVIGGPPALTYAAGTRLPYGVEEYAVAGSLIGEPLDLVRCKTVDLQVPANAELVIEGYFLTDCMEPEAPFGEYTGYMGEREYNAVFQVTAITHRSNPVFTNITSQMPPSESSMLKKVGQDNTYLFHLRNHCGIPQVVDVAFHQIALDYWCVVKMKPCDPAVAWQALYALPGRHNHVGKFAIAVDEDIDPNDLESVIWAMCYRTRPHKDFVTLPERCMGLDPSAERRYATRDGHSNELLYGSMMLVNAMRKKNMAPVSLPARPFMENAKAIWEELGLPSLTPRMPWFGYELGLRSERDREEAQWAVEGNYHKVGERALAKRLPIGDDGRPDENAIKEME